MLDKLTAILILMTDATLPCQICVVKLDYDSGLYFFTKIRDLPQDRLPTVQGLQVFKFLGSMLIEIDILYQNNFIYTYDFDIETEKSISLKRTIQLTREQLPSIFLNDIRLSNGQLSYFPNKNSFNKSMESRIVIDLSTGVLSEIKLQCLSDQVWKNWCSRVVS